MKNRIFFLEIILLILMLSTLGCFYYKTERLYSGSKLPQDQIAILKVFHPVYILSIDKKKYYTIFFFKSFSQNFPVFLLDEKKVDEESGKT